MKKQSLLFYAICMLFALAAKASKDSAYDILEQLIEDEASIEDASMEEREQSDAGSNVDAGVGLDVDAGVGSGVDVGAGSGVDAGEGPVVLPPDPCDSNPCNNGGTCIRVGRLKFTCNCPKAWEESLL
ncbi:Von Willebrand factor A [Desmophyllum pertusum]|uniref:von Willebrand factor A n=1 Tax=Desmophyllum pertusum TaxID=174260 RepID=A0A9X0D7B0_9CNID|nr:Von Willebrand factor A [Desmophyllum pertusum]